MDIVRKPEDRSKIQLPQLNDYKPLPFYQTLRYVWIDIFLVVMYIIIFFSASYVSFLRYDVR